jgi:hypothetical protein
LDLRVDAGDHRSDFDPLHGDSSDPHAVGIIITLVCKIMIWILAYRASIVWLLICLFVPFFRPFVFRDRSWDDTKKIVGWQFLVGLPLIGGDLDGSNVQPTTEVRCPTRFGDGASNWRGS